MKKIILFPTMLALVLAACNKDEKHTPDRPEPIIEDTVKQYSYWTVNEDSFSTNQVVANTYRSPGNALAVLRATDSVNNFEIYFTHLSRFPQSGDFPLQDSSIHYPVSGVGVYFLYHSTSYFIAYPTDHHLSAASVNGKGQYTLQPTWFYGYQGDSVLISGTFNEP